MGRLVAGVTGLALVLGTAEPGRAQSTAPACSEQPGYRILDFWVGEWDVYVGNLLDGHDRVRRVLAGCAVTEEWSDANGGKGFGLFYYLPGPALWRQVWVTDRASQTGGTKEKQLIARLDGGGVRFQGAVAGPLGKAYLDRTTLTPLPSGEVHQVIEVSSDEGVTWRVVYDARYRRSGPT